MTYPLPQFGTAAVRIEHDRAAHALPHEEAGLAEKHLPRDVLEVIGRVVDHLRPIG